MSTAGTAAEQCPDCGARLVRADGDGAKWRCGACGGVLLGAQALEDALAPLGGVELDTVTLVHTTQHCPLCREPMTVYSLFAEGIGIAVSRCANDGAAWFAREDLERARRDMPAVAPLVDKLLA